jgi:hypothetical protein
MATLASIPPLIGTPTSSPSGYPWVDGDVLYAADLNAAFVPAGGGTILGDLNVSGHLAVGGNIDATGNITGATVKATNAVQVGDGALQMYELGTTNRVFAFSDQWLWNWENATGNLTWDASGSGAFITLKADSPAPNYRGVNWLGPWQGNGAYIATSDERMKSDIEDATVGLVEVLGITPIRFRRNGAGQRIEVGFSAQQVASVLPEAVVELGRDDMLGVTSDTIVAALVNAVKALTARIAVLEGEPLKAATEA